MKTKNLNFNLTWDSKRKYFMENLDESNIQFPLYDIIIRNDEDLLINKFNNLSNYIPQLETIFYDHSHGYVCPTIETRISTSMASTEFKYDFLNNYIKYKELNNKIGFFKKIKITVDYQNSDSDDFSTNIEYDQIDQIDKNKLFQKIYRSNDYVSLKMILNKNYIEEKEIYSLLIATEISNKNIKNKRLQNLFIDNIKEKYLDINDKSVMLTIPFIETDLVEITENVNIKVICLNKLQSDMYSLLLEKESQEDINIFFQEFFPNQFFNIGKIYKQSVNNETLIFYQNYLYLFNNQSLNSNSLTSDLSINDMGFNSYFPLLNKNQTNKTICLSNDLNTDDVLDNNYNLQKQYLGFYGKDLTSYEDVAIDLDYLQNQGVLQAKITEIEENGNTCNIYIEFITTFYNNEKFYIETSNNLKYSEKYKTNIDDKDYITLLFKYSYNLETLNEFLNENPSINKSQIISDKDLINFSAKLIL
jgi:hypothetical protein